MGNSTLQCSIDVRHKDVELCLPARHFGFHVFCSNRISPDDETAMENVARYIIRASFSYPEGHKQERIQYLDQEGKFVYTSKEKKTSKVFPTLEWLANLCSHIPNRGKQMVRYLNPPSTFYDD